MDIFFIKSKFFYFITLVALCLATNLSLYANSLKCDKEQKLCVVEDKTLIIEDKVGIFNKDGSIAALGEVVKMKNTYRYINIYKRYREIYQGSYLKRLDLEEIQNIEKSFVTNKISNTQKIGGSVGIGSIDIGEGGMVLAFDGQYIKDFSQYKEMHLEGRGFLFISHGKGQDPDENYEKYTYTIYTLGSTANLFLWFLKNRLVNPYVHLGLGLGYSHRSDTYSSYITYSAKLNSGLSLIFNVGGGIIIDHPRLSWYPKISFELHKIQGALITSLSVGAIFDFNYK